MEQLLKKHQRLEINGLLLTIGVTVAIAIGGMIEIIPPLFIRSSIPAEPGVKPYSALELAGRDIYIREGCSGCHSQMIRPFHWEAVRFGRDDNDESVYSTAGEYVYDRPFLWGSKRTGPDLWRESDLRNAEWHYRHFKDPTMQGEMAYSTHPAYPWLYEKRIDVDETVRSMEILNLFGTYAGENAVYISRARAELEGKREIDGMVAYMMKLGRDRRESIDGLREEKKKLAVQE